MYSVKILGKKLEKKFEKISKLFFKLKLVVARVNVTTS